MFQNMKRMLEMDATLHYYVWFLFTKLGSGV